MRKKILSVLLAVALILSFGLVAAVPVAAGAIDGDAVPVDFGPTDRTPSLEGTITEDGTNLYFSVTVLGQDAADDDYLAFWIDPDYLNKDLLGIVDVFVQPWNEYNKVLYLNFYGGNTDPVWYDGAGGECPWPSPVIPGGGLPLPSGVSLTYTDTEEGMNWEGIIPFSVLGVSAGDTFGYMFAARTNTPDRHTDGYPEPSFTPGWDLRDYNTATIPDAAVTVETEVLADVIAISITPTELPFGPVYRGQSSEAIGMEIINTGTVSVDVSTSTGSLFYQAALTIDGISVVTWEDTIAFPGSIFPKAQVNVPSDWPAGVESGTIIFWAEATPQS